MATAALSKEEQAEFEKLSGRLKAIDEFTSVDGKWQPRPLEEEANIDQRRAQAGLPPLAEYAKLIQEQYGGSPKKGANFCEKSRRRVE